CYAGSTGGQLRKPWHAVIVSNIAACQHTHPVQVVPLSSRTDKLYPCEARVTAGDIELKAMADHPMTVSKKQLTERLGLHAPYDLHRVEIAIRIQFGLAA